MTITMAAGSCYKNILDLRAQFASVGLEREGPPVPIVSSAADIAVHHGSSPNGFTLRDNELKVEPGYDHQILGTIQVRYDQGWCKWTKPFEPNPRAALVELMREKALAKGANAIIYADSVLTEESSPEDLERICFERARSSNLLSASFATGWAVILVKRTEPAKPRPLTLELPESATRADLHCALMNTIGARKTDKCIIAVGVVDAVDFHGTEITLSAGDVQIHGVASCDGPENNKLAATYSSGLVGSFADHGVVEVVKAWRGNNGWYEGGVSGGLDYDPGGADSILETFTPMSDTKEIRIFIFDFSKADHCVVIRE